MQAKRASILPRLFLAALCGAWAGQAGAEMLPRWELGAGVAGISMPEYRGSDQVTNYLLPFPLFVYRLDWLKADRSGVRATVLENERAELNMSVSAGPPVRSKNNRAREGMPDLKPMFEFGPSLDVNLWKESEQGAKLRLLMPMRAAFTVQTQPKWAGWVFQPRLNLDLPKVGGAWNVGLVAGPVFATRQQHAYIYNVDAAYARADRPAYQAKGGYSGTQFLVSLSRKYESVWLGAYVRYDNLRGAAFVDSPLVRRRDYLSAGFAITWTMARSSELIESAD
ncbi:MipA/OmpV family protein [Uliginosibacterium gangwonense]|uniref:MipA/OmpV family protein n=1 Tax=Uliginosibacterium gangwonense TaxID=392736 RepID=UPI0003652E33|nr:MipA/OmpV family protein [Uliginosibacterium gangwonense]